MPKTSLKRQGLSLPETHIASLRGIEDGYWWFMGRVLWAEHLIEKWWRHPRKGPSTYADLGCGTGAFAETISEKFDFEPVILVDRDPKVLRYIRDSENFTIRKTDLERPFELSPKAGLITCMDVIEHLKNDQAFVKQIAKNLTKNGILVLTVPALQSLYSQWDDTLGHYRRYSVREVRVLLENAGLEIVDVRYMWSFLAPFAFYRKLRKSKYEKDVEFPKVSPWINRVLIALSTIERVVTRYLPIPFGTSVIATARKTHP